MFEREAQRGRLDDVLQVRFAGVDQVEGNQQLFWRDCVIQNWQLKILKQKFTSQAEKIMPLLCSELAIQFRLL